MYMIFGDPLNIKTYAILPYLMHSDSHTPAPLEAEAAAPGCHPISVDNRKLD